MKDIKSLIVLWQEAKGLEQRYQKMRREKEDLIVQALGIDTEKEGAVSSKEYGVKMTITRKLTKSINTEKLQEIAKETGLTPHLWTLFNWKPSINKKNFDNAEESIIAPLLEAITTKPSRPTFKIEELKEG